MTRLKIVDNTFKKSFAKDCRHKVENDIKTRGVWKVKDELFRQPRTKLCTDIDELNEHYANISNQIVNADLPTKPSKLDVKSVFKFQKITPRMVFRSWTKLKTRKRTSPDSTYISPIMLDYTIGCPTIAEAVSTLINRSLFENEFLTTLKTGLITPIPKLKSPSAPNHYRPVAVQPILSLLIEKCAHEQLVNYLTKNNLLYPGQFGFRPGHSCETAMVAVTEYI